MRGCEAAQGGLPDVAGPGLASLGHLVFLRWPPGKGPESSRLSIEPSNASEKPPTRGFPEAEALGSQDTAGQHPSL